MSAQKNEKAEEKAVEAAAKSAESKPSESKSAESKPADGPAPAATGDAKTWQEQIKKFAFAAVGAVNLSQDDVKSFVNKLVEKGEIAKKDGEKILKSFADKVQQTVKRDTKAAAQKAEEAADAAAEKAQAIVHQEKLAEKINASIERMLHGMKIATRKDVEELGKQLDELDKKFAQIVEATSARSGGRKAGSPPSAAAAS